MDDNRELMSAGPTKGKGASDRDARFENLAPISEERLRLIEPGAKVRDTASLASNITQALSQYLLCAEQQVLNQTEHVRALVLDELERQRASTESLVTLFADQLRQQEEGLNSLRKELGVAIDRLERQADLLRILNEAQRRDNALWGQLLDIVQRFAAVIEGLPVTSHSTLSKESERPQASKSATV